MLISRDGSHNPYTNSVISFATIENKDKFFTERNVRKRMIGVYGEFRAAYKSIAYLTVTGRNDWSSTLPVENRSYFYPSVSGSFAFTELLPANNILSWKDSCIMGTVGKDADPYMLATLMRPVATVNQNFRTVGVEWTAGNPNLKPEIQTAYELGAELLSSSMVVYTSITRIIILKLKIRYAHLVWDSQPVISSLI